MAEIILIETSTSLCSTALAVDGRILCHRESTEPRAQAAMTALFVKEMLDEAGLRAGDCDAVCVSSGPGSYTGLRVGVSTAKGLCFSAGIPLISVNTLDILACQAVSGGFLPEGCRYIVPMIDARRMEVYTAVYKCVDGGAFGEGVWTPVRKGQSRPHPLSESNHPHPLSADTPSSICPNDLSAGTASPNSPHGIVCCGSTSLERQTEIEARVIDAESFAAQLSEGPVLFIGDGAGKCSDVLSSPNASFIQVCPEARAMLGPAEDAFRHKRFENTAYFEPFYLKQFVATVSKKLF